MYKITSKTAKQQNSKTAKQQNSKTAKQQNSKTAKWSSLSKFLIFCLIAFFSVHCSKKKGGGLGLVALAVAGGGDSSSSSSTVTKCEIKGDQPVYLKRAYTLSYNCVLNTAVQEKTLTIDYDSTIVELSKSSFTLPKTKNASESFTVKTKKNQAFSLTPKIESKSFTKRDFSATKNIPPPTADQIIIEEITPVGNVPPNSLYYSLTIFNNIFYLFSFQGSNYYSSPDGKNWKDEGKVHVNFQDFRSDPLSIVYKKKLYLLQPTGNNILLLSTPIPNSGTALNFTKQGATLAATQAELETNMVLFQDKITLRTSKALYTLNSTTLNLEKKLDFTGDQVLSSFQPLVFEDKLWTFGGVYNNTTTKKVVFSFDGKSVTQEESLPTTLYNNAARVFANGILLIGGETSTALNNPSNDLYWSPDGKDFKSVKNYNKLSGAILRGSVLKSENEIWVYKQTGGNARVYKITFDPTK